MSSAEQPRRPKGAPGAGEFTFGAGAEGGSATALVEPEKVTWTMELDQQVWDELVRKVGVESTDCDDVLDYDEMADMAFAMDTDPRRMTKEDFYAAAASGKRGFRRMVFTEPMGEAETRGMVFDHCDFQGDVVLGDRAVLAGCTVRGSLVDSSSTERGGRVSAIVDGGQVWGDVTFSATSDLALNRCEVNGDLTLRGGNGLHMVAVNEPRVAGLIIMENYGAIVVNNFEHEGNVFAFQGSAAELLKGYSDFARYRGLSPADEREPGFAVKPVYVFSYDDLQEAHNSGSQAHLEWAGGTWTSEHFADMDRRVIAGGRALHKEAVGDRKSDWE